MQTLDERIEALKSLLPLVEAHIACRMTQSYGASEGPPPTRPPGWVPPPPEPICEGHCEPCPDFGDTCTMRELFGFKEWERLRAAYPQLKQIEQLLNLMMREKASWASALYWVYVQPWDDFERKRRGSYAKQGIAWIEERFVGYVPTYEALLPDARSPKQKRRHAVQIGVRDCLAEDPEMTYAAIEARVGCSPRKVREVLAAMGVRRQ